MGLFIHLAILNNVMAEGFFLGHVILMENG